MAASKSNPAMEFIVESLKSDRSAAYKDIAERVFLLTDAKKRMAELGQKTPEDGYRRFKVMGREFDPMQPQKYVESFAIRRT